MVALVDVVGSPSGELVLLKRNVGRMLDSKQKHMPLNLPIRHMRRHVVRTVDMGFLLVRLMSSRWLVAHFGSKLIAKFWKV